MWQHVGREDRIAARIVRAIGNTGKVVSLSDIADLAVSGESETVEFKKTTGQRREAAKTLSAMLNGAGGTVLFGVTDDGEVVGQAVSEKTLEDVTAACSEIRPEFPPKIERINVTGDGGRQVLVVTMPSGNSKPYAYKSDYYIRSGAATVAMPAETQLALLLERAHALDRWEKAESRLELEAIDVDEVQSFRDTAIAQNRAAFETTASVEEVLLALNLLDEGGRPNRGAIVLFGKREAFAYHYAMLGCHLVAVDGLDLAEDFHDEKLVEDNAFASIRRALVFCKEHLRTPLKIDGLEATSSLEIPETVIREALANAFAHRSYSVSGHVQLRIFSDRLQIVSPGGLNFGLVPADLYSPHSSMPWNPNVLAAFYRRGIVEQLGSGTLRMIRLCTEAGLGTPVFTANAATVTCNIPRSGYWLGPDGQQVVLSDDEKALMSALVKGPATRGELAEVSELSSLGVRDTMNRLRKQGLVHSEGHARGARWVTGPE